MFQKKTNKTMMKIFNRKMMKNLMVFLPMTILKKPKKKKRMMTMVMCMKIPYMTKMKMKKMYLLKMTKKKKNVIRSYLSSITGTRNLEKLQE